MKPRDFLNFFKTKSGKLVLFVAVFAGGLLLFSALHGKSGSGDDMDVRVSRSQTNMTDKPQVVQTVVRPMQPFYPPTPKPEPLPTSQTNAAPKVLTEHRPQEIAGAPLPAPIALASFVNTSRPGAGTSTGSTNTPRTGVGEFGVQIGRAHV